MKFTTEKEFDQWLMNRLTKGEVTWLTVATLLDEIADEIYEQSRMKRKPHRGECKCEQTKTLTLKKSLNF